MKEGGEGLKYERNSQFNDSIIVNGGLSINHKF